MTSRRQQLGELLDRVLMQHARMKLLHLAAMPLVGFCYLVHHTFDTPTSGRGVASVVFFSTAVAWWPLVVSAVALRHPNETAKAFRLWQVLFVLLNVLVCAMYLMDFPRMFTGHAFFTSLIHMGLLALLGPLAVER